MTKALLRSAYFAAALAFGCTAPTVNRVVDANTVTIQNHSEDFTQGPVVEPIPIRYVEQENGIRVPTPDWDRGETRYLHLNSSGFLDRHERTEGRIEHDGRMYDCRMDLIDSNNDGAYDLARLTVDYRIRRHRIWSRWGRSEQGRAIIQDQNHDGIVNVMLRDIYDGRRPGMDGIYEYQVENEGGDLPMIDLISRWIIFVRAPQ